MTKLDPSNVIFVGFHETTTETGEKVHCVSWKDGDVIRQMRISPRSQTLEVVVRWDDGEQNWVFDTGRNPAGLMPLERDLVWLLLSIRESWRDD